MSTRIPADSYATVQVRDQFRCLRCGMPGTNWHHRRGRAVVDVHRHCPCNGVWLCTTCHSWVHAHPLMARLPDAGFIVSRHVAEPAMVPVMSRVHGGLVLLDCEGDFVPVDDRKMEEFSD